MKSAKTDPKITALVQLQSKGRELSARARAVEELLLAGDDEGLVFGLEMLIESASAVGFWMERLGQAVTK